ncbi:MAG TPA: 1-deoxy-D-xylulose-5-phosphate reductoisomerase [Gammaproteobacteria bacterium]|nr:1-deoxy-D-xylulose-5-phosphate reductoisomerase [Gammaproteobacteria bacterium]
MTGISILGSTGSIGGSTLDVLRRHPERFRVVALTANRDVERMTEQCREFRPELAVMADRRAAETLRANLAGEGLATEVRGGTEALECAAAIAGADCVMAAIVGGVGLLPTLAAVRAGKRVLLANKEALVMAGHLFMAEVAAGAAELVPIDSEHNAIFQCLPDRFHPGTGVARSGARRILLTASGGPFRRTPLEELEAVTPDQACAHPNWVMGRKISVDSATMMNKGLEVIEACWLFGTTPEHIQVVLHPQSVVHSMVEYVDGSVLAQLGNPDMRTPIAHALGMPERLESGVTPLDLFEVARLDFEPPDLGRFPCLALAVRAWEAGSSGPVVLNAANEVAVESFLDGRIRFPRIAATIEATLDELGAPPAGTIDEVVALDARARETAAEQVRRLAQ